MLGSTAGGEDAPWVEVVGAEDGAVLTGAVVAVDVGAG
jgi:hypothetical protein